MVDLLGLHYVKSAAAICSGRIFSNLLGHIANIHNMDETATMRRRTSALTIPQSEPSNPEYDADEVALEQATAYDQAKQPFVHTILGMHITLLNIQETTHCLDNSVSSQQCQVADESRSLLAIAREVFVWASHIVMFVTLILIPHVGGEVRWHHAATRRDSEIAKEWPGDKNREHQFTSLYTYLINFKCNDRFIIMRRHLHSLQHCLVHLSS